MIFIDKDLADTFVLVSLGDGDVSIGHRIEDTTCFPSLVMKNCSKTKIGDKPDATDSSKVVQITIRDEESLDVLIGQLENCREGFRKKEEREANRSGAV